MLELMGQAAMMVAAVGVSSVLTRIAILPAVTITIGIECNLIPFIDSSTVKLA